MVKDPMLESDGCLSEIVRRLVETFQPARIYLFGSKARGDGGKDSDYDLMVLVNDEEYAPQTRLSRRAYEALRGTGVAADVLVWSQRSFDSRLHLAASLPAAIKKKEFCSMPHDPALVSETEAWFKKAATDLRAAEHALLAQPPLLEDLLFHCQQASEKSLTWEFSYPGDPQEPSAKEAEEALTAADKAFCALLSCIPQEVREEKG